MASAVAFEDLRDLPKKYRMAALADGSIKLTCTGSTYQLYDLERDPFEQNDVWCGEGDYKSLGLTMMTELRGGDSSFPVQNCAD